MIKISTFNLSEKNKDLIINLLADYTCERIEQFIYTVCQFRLMLRLFLYFYIVVFFLLDSFQFVRSSENGRNYPSHQ
jgi:hypothetical protein